MYRYIFTALLAGAAAGPMAVHPASAQDHTHPTDDSREEGAQEDHEPHEMWMTTLPGGWHLMAMAHVFPGATFAAPFSSDSPLQRNQLIFPHTAAMANLESPDSRWVVRLMPNLEGLSLANGEVTLGGWGEGYIDSRHPHTLLHEAMLSFNWWDAPAGSLSLSAGRGFAPYGTEDPMYRPVLKYPTNHHLSQILERWTVNAVYLSDTGLGAEFGVFDGNEPEDWLDHGNIRDFGNSWSGRLSYRFGEPMGTTAPWEVSLSYGRVRETHGEEEDLTVLYNAALRHETAYDFGRLYGLVEASVSDPEHGDGYFSVLGEVQGSVGSESRHRPFYRVEYATRPEYPREATAGRDFFRYDHDDSPIGATRWFINSVGYEYQATQLPVSARPFLEVNHHQVRRERGPDAMAANNLFGGTRFWSFSLGVRAFFGGGPMRMGAYGALDPMTASMREMPHEEMHDAHEHHEHEHHEHHEHDEHEHDENEHDAHDAPQGGRR